MRLINAIIITLILLHASEKGQAQLQIAPNVNDSVLLYHLQGNNLTIQNISNLSDSISIGAFFNGINSGFQIDSGIAITTGSVFSLSSSTNVINGFNTILGTSANDIDLMAVEPNATKDVNTLSFDLIPDSNFISIPFIFGSDEYLDFVFAGFNDALGIFINGPSPYGGIYNSYNLARLPTGSTICVDSINNISNSTFFVDNLSPPGYPNNFDGYTHKISHPIKVIPGEIYHIKIIVGEMESRSFDSGALIEKIHSWNTPDSTVTQIDIIDVNIFQIYPNPSNGSMNLIYSMDASSKGEFIIYDITGKMVDTYTLQRGENNQLLINETELSNGIYFYKILINGRMKASDKLIIIR